MAPVQRRLKSTHRERHSPAVSSGEFNVHSTGRLHTVEDIDVMQMAHKIVESVTIFSLLSVLPLLLTYASDCKAS